MGTSFLIQRGLALSCRCPCIQQARHQRAPPGAGGAPRRRRMAPRCRCDELLTQTNGARPRPFARNSAHLLARRGAGSSALAALTTLALALLGGDRAWPRSTPGPPRLPATATYQEFAVVEEPRRSHRGRPGPRRDLPGVYYRGTYVYYVDGRWYYPAHHGWVHYRRGAARPGVLPRRVHRRRPRHHHVHHHHPHHVTTVRPSASSGRPPR